MNDLEKGGSAKMRRGIDWLKDMVLVDMQTSDKIKVLFRTFQFFVNILFNSLTRFVNENSSYFVIFSNSNYSLSEKSNCEMKNPMRNNYHNIKITSN